MDKNYIKLFKELAHAIEVLSEQVLELNHSKNDTKGEQSASIMRADYQELYDKIRAEDFNPDTLTKKDYAKLLVGAIIIVQQVENKIKGEQKALNAYKIDLIPKLERIVNEADVDDEKRIELASELFEIKPPVETLQENTEPKTEENNSNE